MTVVRRTPYHNTVQNSQLRRKVTTLEIIFPSVWGISIQCPGRAKLYVWNKKFLLCGVYPYSALAVQSFTYEIIFLSVWGISIQCPGRAKLYVWNNISFCVGYIYTVPWPCKQLYVWNKKFLLCGVYPYSALAVQTAVYFDLSQIHRNHQVVLYSYLRDQLCVWKQITSARETHLRLILLGTFHVFIVVCSFFWVRFPITAETGEGKQVRGSR